MRPSPAVLASFGTIAGRDTDPVPLPGGQGTAWRAGQIVLKPAGDPRVARWTAGLYLSLPGHRDPGFRVPRPLRCLAGNKTAILGPLAGQAETGPGDFGQLLARAPVGSLVTEVIAQRDDPAGLGTVTRVAGPVTGLVLDHLAVR